MHNAQTKKPLMVIQKRDVMKRFKLNWKGYMFLLPVFAILITFKYIPFFQALMMSFYEWNGANVKEFIGFQNFIDIFSDKMFLTSLKNVLIYISGNIVIQLTFPLLAAILVFHVTNKKLQSFFKVWFVLPLVVPHIVIYLMWQWIYSGDYGVLNEFLVLVGLESMQHAWLGESATAIWAVIFVNFPWITGGMGISGISFLLYLAGLMSISDELFEVSKIDGMNAWQRFINIEFPLVRSQVKLILTLTIISQAQAFENILVLTNGGPGISTLSPALHLYSQGFTFDKLGYASSLGVLMFVALMILTFINQRFLKNTDKLD